MELYLQMGHGMQAMTQELVKTWKTGRVIISPVNFQPDRVAAYANSIISLGGEVLFDPQMFYPKEGNAKLKVYDYWPLDGVSISSKDGNQTINRELLRINNEIESCAIILPGKEMSENDFGYGLQWMEESAEYFADKTEKPLFATLCLYPETIRDVNSIESLVEQLRKLKVDGFYIIPHPSNNEYIVSDPLWSIGIMKLISCLKLSRRKTIIGYSNHQGLLYALAGADGIASGTYMNTRSFMPAKFKSPKDEDIKQRSTWFYLPTAFCEYKAITLDVANQRRFLDEFKPQGDFWNNYSSMLFMGARPSTTNYKEANSFRHYLHCLRIQCNMLSGSSYSDVFSAYEFMLNNADNKIKDFRKRGISGQNRDFQPALDANRLAMCTNDADYGLRLKLDWNI